MLVTLFNEYFTYPHVSDKKYSNYQTVQKIGVLISALFASITAWTLLTPQMAFPLSFVLILGALMFKPPPRTYVAVVDEEPRWDYWISMPKTVIYQISRPVRWLRGDCPPSVGSRKRSPVQHPRPSASLANRTASSGSGWGWGIFGGTNAPVGRGQRSSVQYPRPSASPADRTASSGSGWGIFGGTNAPVGRGQRTSVQYPRPNPSPSDRTASPESEWRVFGGTNAPVGSGRTRR